MLCTPAAAVKRAVTPKVVKKASRALHPVDNAVYSIQRSAATAIRSGRKKAKLLSFGTVTAMSVTAARRLQQGAGIRSRHLASQSRQGSHDTPSLFFVSVGVRLAARTGSDRWG